MIVFVKYINKNYYKDGKTCAESWVIGILESGLEIEIFDPDCRIGFYRKKKYIECYISIFGLKLDKRKTKENQRGIYIENYQLPAIWAEYDERVAKYHLEVEYSGIQTEDGVYIVGKERFKDFDVKDGDEILFRGLRYDLFCWHPYKK